MPSFDRNPFLLLHEVLTVFRAKSLRDNQQLPVHGTFTLAPEVARRLQQRDHTFEVQVFSYMLNNAAAQHKWPQQVALSMNGTFVPVVRGQKKNKDQVSARPVRLAHVCRRVTSCVSVFFGCAPASACACACAWTGTDAHACAHARLAGDHHQAGAV